MPGIQSVVELIGVARRYPAHALSPEHHQSYPVPVPGPTGLRVAFFYGKGLIIKPGEGLQLQTPSYLAYVNAETGAFQEMKALAPAELGLKHAEGDFLGKYPTLPERMAPAFLTEQLRFFQAYDALLPWFAGKKPVPPAGAEFRALFPIVTEGPWLPYYQALGKEFFAWLEKTKI